MKGSVCSIIVRTGSLLPEYFISVDIYDKIFNSTVKIPIFHQYLVKDLSVQVRVH